MLFRVAEVEKVIKIKLACGLEESEVIALLLKFSDNILVKFATPYPTLSKVFPTIFTEL